MGTRSLGARPPAAHARTAAPRPLGAGTVGSQALANMGVVMGMLPPKGLTLPLVSYGGSSLVITMGAMIVAPWMAKEMVDVWMETKHTEGLEEFAGFLKDACAKVNSLDTGQ